MMEFEWVTLRRPDVINRLRQLRLKIGEEITEEQAFLLVDVCRAIGLNDNEMAVVMGRALPLIAWDGGGQAARREL